jgi:transcriptional regulator with XRE-family HTH domain|tara:strand:- start:414 stop:770 length:357 start_codon:yes stop_codon:yes gene_type:complete
MYRNKIASMLIAYRYARKQTQTKVSNVLGVTFQQVQKYEKSNNGISAEKLLLFCDHYNINLQEFQTGDPYAVLDGADIQPHYKEKALQNIEKLEEKKNDKSRSDENMARESISEGTYI